MPRRLFQALATAVVVAIAQPGYAVPEADHVQIDCTALRLNVNDYSLRHQIKVTVMVSAPDESQLSDVDDAWLVVTNPAGDQADFGVRKHDVSERKFKAAHAKIQFKVVEDSASRDNSNVPEGFFGSAGPYQLALSLRGKSYTGEISFNKPLHMVVIQDGDPVKNFLLKDESPVEIYTEPDEFGPVYYKHQDMSNFVFQLANMEQSLQSMDYHMPVESPKYMFQISVGDGEGGPTRLVNPSKYIDGYQPFMIRSEKTSMPLVFGADEFSHGEVVAIDFIRMDTLEPDTGFTGTGDGLSSDVIIKDRIVYALAVEAPPSPSELGIRETGED